MKRLIVSMLLTLLAVPVLAAQPWAIHEKASPSADWTDLEFVSIQSEKQAKKAVTSRCISTLGAVRKPHAILKIVGPTGEEQSFVCAEVRAANGHPDTDTPVKKGQIKLW